MGNQSERKGLTRRQGLTIVVSLLLAVVIVVSAICLRSSKYFGSSESHALEAIRRLSGGSVVSSMQDSKNIALRQEMYRDAKTRYPDVIAWLTIPGTMIDYPVMQTDDMSYYMNHSFDQEEDVYGSPFLNVGNAPDFSDFCSVVYAHDMNNDTMFGALPELLQDDSFADVLQGILILEDGIHVLTFFACTELEESDAVYLQTESMQLSDIQELAADAVQQRTVSLTESSQVLVLSTLDMAGDGVRYKAPTILMAKIEPL